MCVFACFKDISVHCETSNSQLPQVTVAVMVLVFVHVILLGIEVDLAARSLQDSALGFCQAPRDLDS